VISSLRTSILIAAVSVCAAHPCRADNALLRPGVGTKSIGRGGASIAVYDEAMCAFKNPALPALADESRFDIGLDICTFRNSFRNLYNDDDSGPITRVSPWLAATIANDTSRWSGALGLYQYAGLATHVDVYDPLHGPSDVDSYIGFFKLSGAVAFQATRTLSVGAAISPAYATIDVETPLRMHGSYLAGVPVKGDTALDGFGIGYDLGILYRPIDCLQLGLAYSSETRFNVDGDADVGIRSGGEMGTFDLEVDNLELPRNLGLGVAYTFKDKVRLVGDTVWTDWSSALGTLDLDFSDPDTLFSRVLFGRTGWQDYLPMDWHDTVEYRLGIEYLASENATVRAGYSFGDSPVPGHTIIPPLARIFGDSVSAGCTYRWGRWELSAAYQHMFPNRQNSRLNTSGRLFRHSSNTLALDIVSFQVSRRF